MDADGVTLYLERIFEPYTGQPLLGVGGLLPARANGTIEVRYDGATASSTVGRAESAKPDISFSTQLPFEVGVKTISVVLVDAGAETTVRTCSPADIGDRTPPIEQLEAGLTAKLRGTFSRGLRSLVTGEALSLSRWLARLSRFQELGLKARQKLRYKLLARQHRPRSIHDGYVERTRVTDAHRDAMALAIKTFRHQPVISIIMPVYEVDPKWLREAVQSVLTQTYPRWELCIADDASSRVDLLAEFERLPDDPRIRFRRRPVNGHICEASNTAASLATGDFVALMDNDDTLAPEALFEVVKALQSQPDADLIYSDEDKIDAAGHRYDPQFKPDFSPELLLSYNSINHFTVIRRSAFHIAGGFRPGYEGSQDHDLLLRVTEKTDRILHVPRILYHWRSLPTSTASAAGVKTYVHTSGRRAVEDALRRRNIAADLVVPKFAAKLGLPILALDTQATPSVAVIVYGLAATARSTIQAMKSNTQYDNLTTYLVLESDTTADSLNRLAAARTEEFLVFLAAGLEPQEPRWLSHLIAYSRINGVGAVGGQVRNDDAISYYFYNEVARNVSTLTPGILGTSRQHFERLGGFDATRYPQSLFVADYCHRLVGQGLRCIHVGSSVFRDGTPQHAIDPVELRTLGRAHGHHVDPYSNPNVAHGFTLTGDAGLTPFTQSKPLKLLVMAHNLNSPEGAPRYLSEIVLGLHHRNTIEPSLLSPTDGAGAEVYRTLGLPVSVLNESWAKHFIDGQWSPRTYEAAVNHMMHELDTLKPDAVLANTLLTFPIVEAAARLNIPSVWVIHESYSADVLQRLFPAFARYRCEAAFALASRVIPASHDTAKLFQRCDVRSNIRVIHNGIDPTPYDAVQRTLTPKQARIDLGFAADKVHILSVGTVCERKGQHTLMEAATLLAKTRRDFVIHIVGVREAVPYSSYVRHLVTRYNLDDVIDLVPETNRVTHYLRAADVFACTSHMETFSRSILEAEAFGLPIVSTPCEGLSEQVTWNQNALKFEIGDAASLATHLETLIANPALRQSMGKKSRAAFDNHDTYETMLNHYLAVLQQAAGVIEQHASQTAPMRAAA
ncbi:hypothetical protein BH11PLA2_BH11PLA2_08520 [soil metagenome]